MTRRRRVFLSVVAMTLLAGVTSIAGIAAAEPDQVRVREGDVAQQVIDQLMSNIEVSFDELNVDGLGPPPWTSLVPNRDPKTVQAWKLLAERFPGLKAPGLAPSVDLRDLVITENEPAGTVGDNDTPATGEPITGFGTGEGETDFVRVFGTLFIPPPPPDCGSIEDDGAINIASPTDLNAEVQVQLCTGFMGDGPHGEGNGDFDFYAMNSVDAGQTLIVDVVPSRETQDSPATTIAIYNSAGEQLADIDDLDQSTYLEFVAPQDGDYFALVAGLASAPSNPFDSSSGNGATTTGAYEVFVTTKYKSCFALAQLAIVPTKKAEATLTSLPPTPSKPAGQLSPRSCQVETIRTSQQQQL